MADLRGRYGLEEMEQPLLKEIFSIWCSQLDDRPAPPVQALDAEHFLRFGRHLVVCDVLPDGDVEFRIAGENVVAAKGGGMRGLRTSTFLSDVGENPSLSQFKEAVETISPRYYDGPSYNFEKNYLRCQRLLLPFVDTLGACRKLLGALVYSSDEKAGT